MTREDLCIRFLEGVPDDVLVGLTTITRRDGRIDDSVRRECCQHIIEWQRNNSHWKQHADGMTMADMSERPESDIEFIRHLIRLWEADRPRMLNGRDYTETVRRIVDFAEQHGYQDADTVRTA